MSSVAAVRMLQLVRTLAVAEFKLRYLDAALSYFWGLARPLALFGVLYLVFTNVGNFDEGVKNYGLCLLTSIVLWTFFAESTASALPSLVRRGDLLRKVPFPRSALPMSVALTSLFDLGMNLLALLVFLLAAGVTPRPGWLQLVPLLLLLAALSAGMSLLLSALYVRYRDIDQVWLVVRQMMFYATPILYVAPSLPESVREPLTANPLSAIFTQARHALVDPSAPTAADVLGGTAWLLVPLGIVAGTLAAGVAAASGRRAVDGEHPEAPAQAAQRGGLSAHDLHTRAVGAPARDFRRRRVRLDATGRRPAACGIAAHLPRRSRRRAPAAGPGGPARAGALIRNGAD